jgi:CTP:phosphocholine cytidylyltransferase-like protein
MDAKELQAHILNNYGRSILDMDFTELFTALVDIENQMLSQNEAAYWQQRDMEEQEQWQIEIDADLQREIDEYQQMAEDDREFPI